MVQGPAAHGGLAGASFLPICCYCPGLELQVLGCSMAEAFWSSGGKLYLWFGNQRQEVELGFLMWGAFHCTPSNEGDPLQTRGCSGVGRPSELNHSQLLHAAPAFTYPQVDTPLWPWASLPTLHSR